MLAHAPLWAVSTPKPLMTHRNRFSRFFLFITLFLALCAGMFSPRVERVEAKPNQLQATNVVISEFRFRGDGGGDDEFIELYNPTNLTINISGWLIRGSNTTGTVSTRATIPASTNLLPGQYYLVAHTSYTGPTSANLTYGTGIVDNGGAAITLADGTTIIDQVGITNCAVGCYFETATLPSLGTTSASNIDRSYERKLGGTSDSCLDDGINSTDFQLIDPSNPQNSATPRRGCGLLSDLSLSLSAFTFTPVVGTNVTFTITITNNTGNTATNIIVRDTLPSGLSYVSDDGLGTYNSGTGIWTIPSLASGSSAVLNVTVLVNTVGAKTYITEIWSSEQVDPDSVSGNSSPTEDDYALATVTPTPPPPSGSADIGLTKTVNNAAPNVNDNVVFTVTASNAGPDTATGLAIQDSLPAGMTYVSHTASIGTYNSFTGAWSIASLSSGSNATLKITAQVNSVGAKTNTASVSSLGQVDGNAFNNSASVTITPVGGVADLSLAQSVAKSTSVAGQVTFSITVNNNGPFNATNVVVKDKLPSGFTYVSDDSGGTYNKDTGLWPAGAISNGANKTLKITARVDTSGTLTNTAEVWSADQIDPNSTPGDGSTTQDDDDSVTVQSADLSITKSMDNVTPAVGTDVVFTIRISNAGPNNATNVEVKDLLPVNYTYVSDDSGGSYNSSTGIWTVGTVNNGASSTLRITATLINSSIAINWAEVWKSDQVDIDSVPGNDSRNTDDDASAPSADLRLAQSVSSVNPGLNTNFTFTITITNDGTVGTTGIQVKDQLPSGITYVSYTSSVGTYSSSTGIWTVGTLATGTSATLTITAKISQSGFYTNQAEVLASDLPDPDSTPNNNSTTEDDDESTTVYFRPILINEVAWAGTSSALPDDQWIELYNPSSVAVNISGWTLRSSSGGVNVTLSGTISAGGYYLLERNDNSVVSDVNASQIYTGALVKSGETLTLRDSITNLVDTANQEGSSNATNPWPRGSASGNYPTMERQGNTAEQDSVWVTNTGSLRNGTNRKGGAIYGTPGGKNSTGSTLPTAVPTLTPVPTRIVIDPRPIINEILARPGFDWNQDGAVDVYDEFIEIKNLTAIDVSLSGWKLNTVDGSTYTLPDITLKPGERIVYYGSQTRILLSDGGETLRLVNPSGKIYDAFTYELARAEDKSFCRLPDGTPGNSWFEDCIPTPYLSNTREGKAPIAPDNGGSPVCNLPDTIPLDFFIPECNGYGGDIWNPFYWDFTNWLDKLFIQQTDEKWRTFIE